MGHCVNGQTGIYLTVYNCLLLPDNRTYSALVINTTAKRHDSCANHVYGLPLKLTWSGRKLYHLIGYKLQYGRGHDVDTMTYDDVTKHVFITLVTFGPRREKTCLRGFANNTGADQPAHPRSRISAVVIRFLESIIQKLA